MKELEFGGMIAFDTEFIHCYKRKLKSKLISKRLRKPMKVCAIAPIDKYDPLTKKTREG